MSEKKNTKTCYHCGHVITGLEYEVVNVYLKQDVDQKEPIASVKCHHCGYDNFLGKDEFPEVVYEESDYTPCDSEDDGWPF